MAGTAPGCALGRDGSAHAFGGGATIGDPEGTTNTLITTMTEASDKQITLTIKGARAERGVSLPDFESFIDNFLAALRDYDRAGRGEPTRKSGHPDQRAKAVTAFRLVGFQTGSGVATVEPELVGGDDQLPVDDVPLSLVTLRALADDLAAERGLPGPVLDALGSACRSVGPNGSVEIEIAEVHAQRPLVVDSQLLDRIALIDDTPGDEEVRSVSGRLHLLDLEPDRLGIRTASGVEWSCRYPDTLEERVKSLLDRIVWVEGSGELTSPLRGAMTIEHIEPVDVEQSALFTTSPIDEDALLAAQGITAPQRLDALSDPAWDDETDDAYLAALLSK